MLLYYRDELAKRFVGSLLIRLVGRYFVLTPSRSTVFLTDTHIRSVAFSKAAADAQHFHHVYFHLCLCDDDGSFFTCGKPRRRLLSHFAVQKVLVYLYTFRSYLTYTTQSLSRVGIAGIKVGSCSRS
jgi:hypothetical protein